MNTVLGNDMYTLNDALDILHALHNDFTLYIINSHLFIII